MNFKYYVESFKKSLLLEDIKDKASPLVESLKSGGYKIVLMSLLISFIFVVPVGVVMTLMSTFLLGGAKLIGFKSVFSFFDYFVSGLSYFNEGAISKLIIGIIGYILLYLISLVVLKFLVFNASFKSLKSFYIEKNSVGFGNYFRYMFKGAFKFSVKIFLNVDLPILLVSIVGGILSFVPYIKGVSIVYIVNHFLFYALSFRFTAMLLELDYDKLTVKLSNYWLPYAVVSYLITSVTSLQLVLIALQIIFILYSIIYLSSYLQKEDTSDIEQKDIVSLEEEEIEL